MGLLVGLVGLVVGLRVGLGVGLVVGLGVGLMSGLGGGTWWDLWWDLVGLLMGLGHKNSELDQVNFDQPPTRNIYVNDPSETPTQQDRTPSSTNGSSVSR